MSLLAPPATVASVYLNSSAQIAVIVINAVVLVTLITLVALNVAVLRHPVHPEALTPQMRHNVQLLRRLQVIFVLAALPASVISFLSALDILPTSALVYETLSLVFYVLAYACQITVARVERGVGHRH